MYMLRILRALNPNINNETYEAAVDDVIRLETALAAVSLNLYKFEHEVIF